VAAEMLKFGPRLADNERGRPSLPIRPVPWGISVPVKAAIDSLLALENGRRGLQCVVDLAHRHLGLDVAYVAELTGDQEFYRVAAGETGSFAIALDVPRRREISYNRLLAAGTIPEVIPDTSALPAVAGLEVTKRAAIGSFIGVPLRLSDGSLYGTLCGMDHDPDPTLGERDARVMNAFAELIAGELDEQRRLETLRVDITHLIDVAGVDIAYQPIVELSTRRCLGVEALARFPKPFGPPDQTFADAERVGLALEVERLTIREAWKTIDLLAPSQFLTINVTPTALLELGMRAQRRDDLPLDKIVVEITEQSVVESYAKLRNVLAPLRRDGLRIAIDDAGAGWASLHHVVELHPDFIKVDRSLVHGVADDHARRVAVSAFVLLSLDLGATVVAEGVESRRDAATLQELGVHAAQGYALGRPSTAPADLARWTRAPSAHALPIRNDGGPRSGARAPVR
jgi:EAL domain-containing protein (putative c-di-GMP-specific phosphodiesterase class I)